MLRLDVGDTFRMLMFARHKINKTKKKLIQIYKNKITTNIYSKLY